MPQMPVNIVYFVRPCIKENATLAVWLATLPPFMPQ
jgi:hypothetical protein